MKKYFEGNVVDIHHRAIFPGRILVDSGRIMEIKRNTNKYDHYILPGFVDAHVHIESSMLTPGGFAQLAVTHGTVASVSDPHEIANVLGMKGVYFMIKDAEKTPFKFYFGAPSCVPATTMETSGAEINVEDIYTLLQDENIYYLSEMMNFPGVINNVTDVIKKIQAARDFKKPVDGHAPGLRGVALEAYIRAGITTDHECFDLDEATEKIEKGMMIQIRDGSAAKNFESLYSLVDRFPEKVMLCSDDIHPDDLKKGHINILIKRGLDKGLDVFNLLNAALRNPVLHYKLDVGMLQENDPADFILIDGFENFHTLQTVINGNVVFEKEKIQWTYEKPKPVNIFMARSITRKEIKINDQKQPIRIIKAIDGELITRSIVEWPEVFDGQIVPDPQRDIMKIVVVNRYQSSKPSVGFIKGFGMTEGALGSSIAHDSHNVIAIGASDEAIIAVVNEIIDIKGGLAVNEGGKTDSLKLEIAGIISAETPEYIIKKYTSLNEKAKSMCRHMKAPFMTLSFMSLLVIPELKLSDRGLFDVNRFEPATLFQNVP